MIVRSLEWVGGVDGFLEIVDQRKLPAQFVKLQCRSVEQVYEAIKTLAVRGAPAIGVAGAYGLVLALQKLRPGRSLQDALGLVQEAGRYLASSRPTAVNLSWALNRVVERAVRFVGDDAGKSVASLKRALLDEARAIHREDAEMCRRIGENGQRLIKDGDSILTHCNAGALATAGQGTALSVVFEAHKRGKKLRVYADETRPLLQGARLTAWELQQAGIDVTVICDNMAGWLMKQGKITAVITGADRIAANGDTANKIGTYTLSVLAGRHRIPFYVAAPSSTFDLSIKSGADIPIEQRAPEEVTSLAGIQIAPEGIHASNYAFDVTSAGDITAIITERGIIFEPNEARIAEHLA